VTRPRRLGVGIAAALSCLAIAPAASSADPLPPAELRVEGGEEAWHPGRRFRLEWSNPQPPGGPAIAAVHYQVRDPAGTIVIPETRLGWPAEAIGSLEVPATPGAYLAEVWLEDSSGAQGPAATARLRFDNARPGHSEPLPEPAWIGRNALPYVVRVGHPEGALPVSGIRGYAVSIDSSPQAQPCRAVDRCAETEVDLPGGADNDSLPIQELPEGTSYVHVVAVSGSLMHSATPGQAELRVDKTYPLTQLAGAPDGWTNRAVTVTASATDALSGMQPLGQGIHPFTAIRVDGGAPVVATGSTVSATLFGEGEHTVSFYARDAAGNVNDGSESNGKTDAPPGTAVVGIDRTPPGVAFFNSQDGHEPETIRVKVGDSLSGPSHVQGWIGVRRAGTGDRFEALASRPEGDRLSAHWDSDAFPRGDYEFRAIGFDSAGNASATGRRANGTRMVLSSPLKGGTALTAHLRRPRGGRLLAYGGSAVLSGRLSTARGRPLGSLPIRVVERFAAGAEAADRVSTAITRPDGRFAVRLRPGPDREVTAVFEGSTTLARAVAPPRAIGVRTRIRLSASASYAKVGGPPLVFRGRVAAEAGAIPHGGKSVELQFRARGVPWTEFRTIHTDAQGRFRYAYRFSDDDSRGIRFEFRAYAPAQDGWPYEPRGSRAVVVRGR
jgi:hypothetical protein